MREAPTIRVFTFEPSFRRPSTNRWKAKNVPEEQTRKRSSEVYSSAPYNVNLWKIRQDRDDA